MPVWVIAFVPVAATLGGAWLALVRPPGPGTVSAVQHLAAGVVLAAAAAEVLPGLKHAGAGRAVALGGGAGIALMLAIRRLDKQMQSTMGLLATVGLDVLVDGLVLGAAATAGERAGGAARHRAHVGGAVPSACPWRPNWRRSCGRAGACLR